MSLFEQLEQNCKVIFDGDAFAYFKADDVQKYLNERESVTIISSSANYINVEISVPVEMININDVKVEGCVEYPDCPAEYDTSHDHITIDGCNFEILDYDENEVNELAFERWEHE